MKWSRIAGHALLVALAAGVALAADVTGKWVGQMNRPDGEGMSITFNFKQDGTTLTGTVEGPQGEPLQIKEGKVEGDKLSFVVIFGDGERKIGHEGKITGDEISLTVKMNGGGPGGGGPPPMKLKRAK